MLNGFFSWKLNTIGFYFRVRRIKSKKVHAVVSIYGDYFHCFEAGACVFVDGRHPKVSKTTSMILQSISFWWQGEKLMKNQCLKQRRKRFCLWNGQKMRSPDETWIGCMIHFLNNVMKYCIDSCNLDSISQFVAPSFWAIKSCWRRQSWRMEPIFSEPVQVYSGSWE